jgi:hypothetical protein
MRKKLLHRNIILRPLIFHLSFLIRSLNLSPVLPVESQTA